MYASNLRLCQALRRRHCKQRTRTALVVECYLNGQPAEAAMPVTYALRLRAAACLELALLLHIGDPRIVGVIVMEDHGTGKATTDKAVDMRGCVSHVTGGLYLLMIAVLAVCRQGTHGPV